MQGRTIVTYRWKSCNFRPLKKIVADLNCVIDARYQVIWFLHTNESSLSRDTHEELERITCSNQEQDQNLIIARGKFSYYIFVPHFVLQKSIIGLLPLSRREQQDQNLIIARGNLRETFSYYIFVLQKSIIGSLPLSRSEQKFGGFNLSRLSKMKIFSLLWKVSKHVQSLAPAENWYYSRD